MSNAATDDKARVLTATQLLLSDLSNVSTEEITGALRCLVADALTTHHLPNYMESLRPIVKAATMGAAHHAVPQELWATVLALLQTVADTVTLPWAVHAFVLKALPDMLPSRVAAESSSEELPALAEMTAALSKALLPYATGPHIVPQLQRVAYAALLALPDSAHTPIAQMLLQGLPATQETCIALIATPSTSESLHRAFEREAATALSTTFDSHSSNSSTAPVIRTALQAVYAALQQHYKRCGLLMTESMCGALVARGAPVAEGSRGLGEYFAFLLQPILTACQGTPLQTRSDHKTAMTALHRACVRRKVSVGFLTDMLRNLWMGYVQRHMGEPNSAMAPEEAEATLLVARGLVDLSTYAAWPAAGEGCLLLRILLQPLFDAAGSRRMGDVPLPLLECALVLGTRLLGPSMSAAPPVSGAVSTPGEGMETESKGDDGPLVELLQKTHDEVADVASRVTDVLPASKKESTPASKKGSTDLSKASDAELPTQSAATAPVLESQLLVLHSIAAVSKKLHLYLTANGSSSGTKAPMTVWRGSWQPPLPPPPQSGVEKRPRDADQPQHARSSKGSSNSVVRQRSSGRGKRGPRSPHGRRRR